MKRREFLGLSGLLSYQFWNAINGPVFSFAGKKLPNAGTEEAIRIKEIIHGSWTNFSKLHTAHPEKYYLPKSAKEISFAIKQAEKSGMKIRAVGSGHSSTDIAITDGILLDMKYIKGVEKYCKEGLRNFAKELNLVQIAAGESVHSLTRKLDEIGLAMPTLGIIDDQTISGAIATATHGNVKSLPGLPGLVRSVHLIASGGKQYRSEPANGITDPWNFKEEDVKLVQDDEIFYSSLVHLGTFGIIASYVLEVVPQYWLLEMRTVEKWSDIRKKIEQDSLHNEYPVKVDGQIKMLKPYGLHFAMNPHRVKADHTCMVGRFFILNEKPSRSFLERTRSIGPNIVARTMVPYELMMRMAEHHPEKMPQAINRALMLMKDQSYINKSHLVWYQGLEFLANMTFGSEFVYDGNKKFLEAIDEIISGMKDISQTKGLYAPNTLMVRWTSGSPAILAPEQGMKTGVWVGMPVPRKMERKEEINNVFQEINIRMGGKSHWGKMNNCVENHPGILEKWYEKLDIWKSQMRRFNPLDTFSNKFTHRFGLTVPLNNFIPSQLLSKNPD